MDKIYQTLAKDYNIKSTQIRILKALEIEKLTARQIVKKTGIPIGSIYELLNELVEFKLIQKKKNPYTVYYIKDLSENLTNFADEQISRTTNAREQLINSLKTRKSKITAFSNYLKFKLECVKQDPYPKYVFGLITDFRFPIFFFTKYFEYKRLVANYLGQHFSKEEELKNSINIKKYKELEEKSSYKWLINKNEFDIYLKLIEKNFSKQEKQGLLNHIKKTIKQKNIEIRFTEEKKDYQFIVTNNTVQFQLRNEPMFIGMVISNEETRTVYEEMFLNIWKGSKNLLLQ